MVSSSITGGAFNMLLTLHTISHTHTHTGAGGQLLEDEVQRRLEGFCLRFSKGGQLVGGAWPVG